MARNKGNKNYTVMTVRVGNDLKEIIDDRLHKERRGIQDLLHALLCWWLRSPEITINFLESTDEMNSHTDQREALKVHPIAKSRLLDLVEIMRKTSGRKPTHTEVVIAAMDALESALKAGYTLPSANSGAEGSDSMAEMKPVNVKLPAPLAKAVQRIKADTNLTLEDLYAAAIQAFVLSYQKDVESVGYTEDSSLSLSFLNTKAGDCVAQ